MIKQSIVCPQRGARTLACVWLFLLAAVAVKSQTPPLPALTAQSESEETIALSPFVVNVSSDNGYLATNTLAGSRLNTSLLTTPSAISVFTKDFLDDIAAGSVADASLYALNAEPLLQSNPSANFEANIFSPNAVQFRGFGAGGQSRNYFPWAADSDSYNTDRLDFSRGPNSILFGTGTPGGIINVTPKRAALNRSFGGASFRVGNRDSYRSTIDYNLVLKKDILAVRLNNVWEESESEINHAFTKRTGYHGALTYQPFKNTTIRLDAENLEQDRNIGRRFPLFDFFSGWTGTTIATAGGAVPANAGLARINVGNLPVVVYDAHAGTISNWQNQARTQTDRGSVLEPTVGRTQNFFGPDDRNDSRTENYSVFIEQRLFDKLFLEASYNKTNFEIAINRPFAAGTGSDSAVFIDPNAQLPGGAPNPNVGKHYVDGNWTKQDQGSDTEDYRLTASYEVNLGKWAGRHEVAGLYWRRDDGFHSTISRETDVNRVFAPTAALNSTALKIIRRHYLANGDGASETALKDIDGVQGINSEFVVWQGNQLTDQVTRQDAKQVSIVSHFLNERLTVTAGLRHDKTKVRSRDGRAQDNPLSSFRVTGDFGDWRNHFGKDTVTTGAVLELGKGFFAFANRSENFNVPGNNIRVPVIGDDGKFTLAAIPPRTGIGKDIGLRYRGFDGRLHASIGYYKTSENDRTFFWAGAVNTQSKIIIDKLEPGQWIANFQDTSDTRGDGYELEITANPTPRWRITLNASRKETQLSKQGAFFKELFARQRAAWLASGDPAVLNAINIIEPLLSTFTRDGQRRLGERKYTANMFTNFELGGRLDGFSIGGGLRYLGPALIGYDDANADRILETFHGGEDLTMDLTAGYRRKLANHRSVKVQLNVRNLLPTNDVQRVGIVSTAFDQEGGTIIYKQPRQVLLTTTITF